MLRLFWQVSKNNEPVTLVYYSWLNHITYNEVKEKLLNRAFTKQQNTNNFPCTLFVIIVLHFVSLAFTKASKTFTQRVSMRYSLFLSALGQQLGHHFSGKWAMLLPLTNAPKAQLHNQLQKARGRPAVNSDI